MKVFGFIKNLPAHLCVICSTAWGVFGILDWYNPYMDFEGHAKGILCVLCLSAFLMGVTRIFCEERKNTRNQRRGRNKRERKEEKAQDPK